MDFNTFELKARFQSRTAWVGLSDLVGSIGDRLATIEVTGPLWDPSARLLPLAALASPDEQMTVAAPVSSEDVP